MTLNIDQLKKKIIYRSNYRGTKEMDKLLGSFTKKYIELLSASDLNDLDCEELISLSNLLYIDDENLYKLNQGLSTTVDIKENKVSKLLKEFKYKK